MKHTFLLSLATMIAFATPVGLLAANPPKTKIVIQSIAADSFPSDAPCFLVFSDETPSQLLRDSGIVEEINATLQKMGYSIVANQNDAAVFVRIHFQQHEPYATVIDVKSRPRIDYSNAGSTRNYAAMMKGGRYQQLANPTRARNRNEEGALLGPSGEVIMLSELEANEPKVIEDDPEAMQVTVHPLSFEISAWSFSQDSANPAPKQLWATLASYNNLLDEELQPQLKDLSKAATRFLGKNLKNEKLVSR